jgi:hypothetical protein
MIVCALYDYYCLFTVLKRCARSIKSLEFAGIFPPHVQYLRGSSELKVCITPVCSKQDGVGILWEMCDLKLFQTILLVNCELLCLFSGNVSIVLSNDYSDIC